MLAFLLNRVLYFKRVPYCSLQASISNVKASKTSKRAVVVAGLPTDLCSDQLLATLVKSHYQDDDGAVEDVLYPTRAKGVAYRIVKEKRDAEKDIRQKKHCLDMIGGAQLTVSHFSDMVFNSVTALLDLSVFGSNVVLENLIGSLQEKIPALSFSSLDSNGRVFVAGSFSALKRLRESLLLKANSLLGNTRDLVSERKKGTRQSFPKGLPRSGDSIGLPGMLGSNVTGHEETVVLDTDVFLYLKKKCRVYEESLDTFHVLSQERVDGDITTISLKHAQVDSHRDSVRHVKQIVEELSQSLQCQLRKETLLLKGKNKTEKANIIRVCKQLQPRYQEILINSFKTHIDIIGSSTDIYLFTKEVMELIQQKIP